MILVDSELQLRQHLPNVIATVKGETSFFDRCKTFLQIAENWICDNFIPLSLLLDVSSRQPDDPLLSALCRLETTQALIRAVPSLDTVLSPNGFAVVQSQNLLPASHHRVDRLIKSLTQQRDDAISDSLALLPSLNGWLDTPQALFLAETLFPDLAVIDATAQNTADKWSCYIQLKPRIILAENRLADSHFSRELMAALRTETIAGCLSEPRRNLVSSIQALVIDIISNNMPARRTLDDAVTFINNHPNDFPEWFNSDTAALFSPPIFKNEKNSSGYFF